MALGADLQLRAARAQQDRRSAWVGLEQGSVMGLELLVAICLWAGVGWLVDDRIGTEPWFLTVGALVGYSAGMYLIWLRSARMQADDDARREGSDRGSA